MRAQDPRGLYVDFNIYLNTTYEYSDPGNPSDPMSLPGGPAAALNTPQFDMGPSLGVEAGADSIAAPAAAANTASGTVPVEIKEPWYTYDRCRGPD